MNLFDFFRERKKLTNTNSATIAKERLQIIVASERRQRGQPDYMVALQKDILDVIRKYVPINDDQVQVLMENQGHCSILELNITLPES